MEILETRADFPRAADELARSDIPVTVLMDNTPLVVTTPAAHDAVSVATNFMDGYASVFEGLAK